MHSTNIAVQLLSFCTCIAWSFSFSSSPSNEYSGLISFRTDWLDLLAVQGTLKRLLQHHSSKASILGRSAVFIVQLLWISSLSAGDLSTAVCFGWSCSGSKSCSILCHLMDYSLWGSSVLHFLPEFASDSCPLSQWCQPTISSSVIPFSSRLQSFPASGFFFFSPMSQLFASRAQSIGASASVLPVSIQGWFPLGLTACWVSSKWS